MGRNSCSSCTGTGSVSDILLCLEQMIRGGYIIVCEMPLLCLSYCRKCALDVTALVNVLIMSPAINVTIVDMKSKSAILHVVTFVCIFLSFDKMIETSSHHSFS